MNMRDFLAVKEMMDTFGEKKKPSPKTDFSIKEYLKFKKALKALEEEEKKDAEEKKKKEKDKEKPKGGLSHIQMIMLLLVAFPFVAPPYVYWVKHMFGWH